MPPPGFPGAAQPPRKLVQTDRTREIHGRECTLYTLTDPEEGTLEIWTTSQLGPFHLHASGPPGREHRGKFVESWPALVREAGLFPFLAVLKIGEQEAYRFEVTAIVTNPAAARDDPFPVPPRFHESELLDF
ncbi:MAG: DUF4412 domain-containing protein [Akkermansiaceae bacterium]|nr:DUF4412 domain-containing protein [Akkermansiaceae bacterium]